MILRWSDRDGWVLKLGKIPHAHADAIGDLVATFQRARRGGFIDALLALAEARKRRGARPGAASLRLFEAGGDPISRPCDWQESAEIGPATRSRRAGDPPPGPTAA